MPTKNDGVYLQTALQNALKLCCQSKPAFYYRFPDTKAARGAFLQRQPGDFLFVTRSNAHLIECKSTTKGVPLQRLLDVNQLGKHRLWLRTGQPAWFLYHDKQTDVLAAFPAEEVVSGVYLPIVFGGLQKIHDAVDWLLNAH